MSFGISWSRCGERMCRCRSCPRHDRDHLPWTLSTITEQVVGDILLPGGAGLTVREHVTLHHGVSSRLEQQLRGTLIVGCPWQTGGEVLAILAPRATGRRNGGGRLLAPYA